MAGVAQVTPLLSVKKFGIYVADWKVLAPANICDPVLITHLALAQASGILKVCVLTEETIPMSLPEVHTAKS
jgi:hypothetical protein